MQATWNPSIGCHEVSYGCQNCYAKVMARQLQERRNPDYKNGFRFTMLPHRLQDPCKNKKPTVYFVGSMSDVFHEQMELSFLDSIMQTIQNTPQHQYQILTKRPMRMLEYFCGKINHPHSLSDGIKRAIAPNMWLGTTVECLQTTDRIEILKSLQAPIRWLCCEPLLSSLGALNLSGIDWVVVGGESGYYARAMQESWVLELKEQCEAQGVAFYFKQWGAFGSDGVKRRKKDNGALLQGKLEQNYPLHFDSSRYFAPQTLF